MSRVYLIAADRPLPLYEAEQPWTRVIKLSELFRNPDLRGQERTVSGISHFNVQEHSYYRSAVSALDLEMKPCQYELEVEKDQWGLEQLVTYLKEHFTSGEQVELWSLWVGDTLGRPVRYAGSLADFDLETLQQFFSAEAICITITI